MLRKLFTSQRSDGDIVRRVLAGRHDDFGLLVQRHLDAVQAIAYAQTGNFADAEDVAQDAFLKAYQRLDTLRDSSKFRCWLLSIVRNLSADLRDSRRREMEFKSDNGEGEQPPIDTGRQELRTMLLARIHELDETSREILLLYYFAANSTKDIAQSLDISVEAVKKRLQRAREALSANITEDLRGLLEPEAPRDQRTRKIMGGLAGAAVPWSAARASAASWSALSTGLGVKTAVLATATITTLFIATLGSRTHTNHEAQRLDIASDDTPGNAASADRDFDSMQETSTQDASARFAVAAESDSQPVPTEEALDPPPLGSLLVLAYGPDRELRPDVRVVIERVDWEPDEAPPEDIVTRESKTDATGRRFFSDLPLGVYIIRGYGEKLFDIKRVELGGAGFQGRSYLNLESSASITGRVTDEAGNGVTNATIYSYLSDSDPEERYLDYRSSSRVHTQPDGTFDISHIWPGRMRFYVKAPGYATLLTDFIRAGAKDVALVMDPGTTHTVSVVDADGNQLGGVEVMAAAAGAYRDRVRTETANDGVAFFTGLRAAQYIVSLPDPKWSLAGGPVLMDLSEERDPIALTAERAGSATGAIRLAEDNTPLPHVFVRAQPSPSSGLAPVTALTDEDGKYTLAGLSKGTYTVRATSYDGYIPIEGENERQLTADAGKVNNGVDFRFTNTVSIAGAVNDADGNTVPNAEVHLNAGNYQTEYQSVAVTDEAGRFALHGFMPSIPYYIWARSDNQLCEPLGKNKLPLNGVETVSLTIHESASVAGVVVDQDGNPAPGVGVSASPENYMDIGMVIQYASLGRMSMYADGQGRFKIKGLYPGKYDITVTDPGDNSYSDSNVTGLTLEPGEHRDGLLVEWIDKRGSMTISGVVVNEQGEPIERASVQSNLSKNRQHFSARTDQLGRFTLENMPDETFSVNASHDAYSSAGIQDVHAGTSGVRIVLGQRGDLVLSVIDAETQEPIREFGVAAGIGAYEGYYERFYLKRDGMRQVRSEDGSYSLENRNASLNTVLVEAPGYAAAMETVVVKPRNLGMTSLTVGLEPGGTIHGLVADSDGNPIQGAEIFAQQVPGEHYLQDAILATSNSKGQVEIDSLSPESGKFYAVHPGYARTAITITPTAGAVTDAKWVMPEGGVVRGTLTHDGAPAVGQWIALHLGGFNDYENYLRARTNADGTFRLEHVPTGAHELWAQWVPEDNAFFRYDAVEVSTANDGEHDVNIEAWSGSGAFEGSLMVNNEPDRQSMYMRIHYHDSSVVFQESGDEDGTFWIERMPAGAATIEARYKDRESGEDITRYFDIVIPKDDTLTQDINITF